MSKTTARRPSPTKTTIDIAEIELAPRAWTVAGHSGRRGRNPTEFSALRCKRGPMPKVPGQHPFPRNRRGRRCFFARIASVRAMATASARSSVVDGQAVQGGARHAGRSSWVAEPQQPRPRKSEEGRRRGDIEQGYRADQGPTGTRDPIEPGTARPNRLSHRRPSDSAAAVWSGGTESAVSGWAAGADRQPDPYRRGPAPTRGKPFPAIGKLSKRKTHTTKGSVNSWLASGDVATAETIIDVEGITDLLAVVSAGLPAGWVAVTNTAGAKARGRLPRPWAKAKKIIVAGDADEPGQKGQRRSAAEYHQAIAEQVLLAQLPYPVEKDHGRDLRDWLLEGHKPDELPTVAVTAEEAAAWAKKTRRSNSEREIIIDTDETRGSH